MARTTFYDYGDLTPNEKKFLRNMFTFYAFAKKNMAHHLRTLFQRPGNLVKYYRFAQATQRDALSEEDDRRFDSRNSISVSVFQNDRFFYGVREIDTGDALANNAINQGYIGNALIGSNIGIRDGLLMASSGLSLLDKPTSQVIQELTEFAYGQVSPTLVGLVQMAGLPIDPFGTRPLEQSSLTEDEYNILSSYEIGGGARIVALDTDSEEIKASAMFLVTMMKAEETVPTPRGPRLYRMAAQTPNGKKTGVKAQIQNGQALYLMRQVTAIDPRLQRSSGQTKAIRSILLPIIDPDAKDPYENYSLQSKIELAIGVASSNIKQFSLKEQDIIYQLKKESQQN